MPVAERESITEPIPNKILIGIGVYGGSHSPESRERSSGDEQTNDRKKSIKAGEKECVGLRMPRRRYGGVAKRSRWAPVAARATGWALRSASKWAKSRIGEALGSKKTAEMAPLTAEKDVRTTYRKRRMPRAKRRRYVRSLKRFRSNLMKSEASRIHMLNWVEKPVAATDTSRYFGAFMGMMANNVYDTAITNLWNNLESAATAKVRQANLRLDHMALNVVIRNSSTGGTTGGIMDLDVYKVLFIRDVPLDRWTTADQIETFMAAVKSEMRQHTGMDVAVTDAGVGISTLQTNAGTTNTNQAVGDILFNNPPFLRYIRVLKAWKVQLGAGQTVTFNWRDSRNRVVARPECTSSEAGALAAKRYLTKGYIFNINGRYGTSSYDAVSCTCEHYVRYNFKPMVPISSDTLVYDPV